MPASAMYACGCTITSSMFGERELMAVMPCYRHTVEPDVQECLRQLATAMREAMERVPWIDHGDRYVDHVMNEVPDVAMA